jgi:hypothetical protein
MLVAAGCSSSTPASSTSTTESEASLAARYLTDAGIADRAYAKWETGIVGKTTPSEFVAPAFTYASELTTFDDAIEHLPATGTTETDIQAVLTDDAVLISDLRSVGSQTELGLIAWGRKLRLDGAAAIAASSTVRADLGLPAFPG